jgi:hypothetical protein
MFHPQLRKQHDVLYLYDVLDFFKVMFEPSSVQTGIGLG